MTGSILRSSVLQWQVRLEQYEVGAMRFQKRMGPKTDHWGTPLPTGQGSSSVPRTEAECATNKEVIPPSDKLCVCTKTMELGEEEWVKDHNECLWEIKHDHVFSTTLIQPSTHHDGPGVGPLWI